MNLSKQIDDQFASNYANLRKTDVLGLIKQTTEKATTCIDCMHADFLSEYWGNDGYYVSCQKPKWKYWIGSHNIIQTCDDHTEA